MNVETTDFQNTQPIWAEYLWPERGTEILPTSYINPLGRWDVQQKLGEPTFLSVQKDGKTIGVISGFKTSIGLYRSRGLWVHPKFRRQQIATLLLQKLEEVAIAENCTQIWTMPRLSSWPFYLSQGFSQIGSTHAYEFGPHILASKKLISKNKNLSLREKHSEIYSEKHSENFSEKHSEIFSEKHSENHQFAPNLNDNTHPLNLDAWSDGQVRSKLWLCHVLEKIWPNFEITTDPRGAHLWVYGSWYGTLAQFLLIREKIKIRRIDFFDIDKVALEISKKMVSMWEHNKLLEFGFNNVDCSQIPTAIIQSKRPDLTLNTSCEHFENYNWFFNLPVGQKFLAQSNNMKHPTHILCADSLEAFRSSLGQASETHFADQIEFRYQTSAFDRYMIIGQK